MVLTEVFIVSQKYKKLGLDVEVWGITKNIELDKHEHNYPLICLSLENFSFLK